MNKKIDVLIEKHSGEFDIIIENINNYLIDRRSNNDSNTDELWRITTDCVNSLSKLAEICFSYGNFKDEWEYSHFYQHIFGPELIIKSLKTKCDYQIGIESGGIYLSTDLRFNDNLRYMGDDFWKLLLELSDCKGFFYGEYEFTRSERRKEFPELFSANKSMIYKIMRKYIFDQTDTDFEHGSSSVGEFKILWEFDTDIEDIIRECCAAFKIMYQLNYKLWKIDNLKK